MNHAAKMKNLSFEDLKSKCYEWYDKIITDQKYYSDDDNIIFYTSSPDIISYLFKIYENLLVGHLITPKIILENIFSLIHNKNIISLDIKPIYEFFYNNILGFLQINNDNKFTISSVITEIVMCESKIQYQLLDLFLNMSDHFYSYDLNDKNKMYYIDYNNQLKIDRMCKTQKEFKNCTPFYKIIMVKDYKDYKDFILMYHCNPFNDYFNIEILEINYNLIIALSRYKLENKNSLELLLSKNKTLNIIYFIQIFINDDDVSIEILDIMLSYHISNILNSQIEKLWKLLSKVKIFATKNRYLHTLLKIDIEYENVSEIETILLNKILVNYLNDVETYGLIEKCNIFNAKLQKLEDFLLNYV